MAAATPDQLRSAVINAINERRIDGLRELLEANRGLINHEFIFPRWPFATSLLWYALEGNDVNVARLLLEFGANPDFLVGEFRIDWDGYTLLIPAIVNGFDEFVEALIRGGADVNIRASFRPPPDYVYVRRSPGDVDTPLLIAAEEGQTNIVRMLLENGASVDFVGKADGKTILQNAQENKYNPEINALIINSAGPANNVPPLPPAPVAARPNTSNHRRTARRRKARRTTRRSHRR